MIGPYESAGFDRGGILAVLSGLLLCGLAAALPLLLLPHSSRCARTNIQSFCDEIAGMFGTSADERAEAP